MTRNATRHPAKRRRPVRLRVITSNKQATDESIGARIGALPFVRTTKRDRCYWRVAVKDRFSKDYQRGKAWARLALPLLKEDPSLLCDIIGGMIKAGDPDSGHVWGFNQEIAQQFGSGLRLTDTVAGALDELEAKKAKAAELPPPRLRKVWDRDAINKDAGT